MEEHIVCWGEVLWDLFPEERRLGGAVANVAFHLAQLGVRAALVSRVGNDALGREAVAALAAVGVDVTAVQIDPERPTGRVGVELEDGEPRYRLFPGCAWERIDLDAAAERAVAGAAVLYYGTLSQRREEGRASLERALARAPERCLRACDPNFRPGAAVPGALLRATLGAADLVKLSEEEARAAGALLGIADVGTWLLDELGVEMVALTRGARGAVLATRAERVEVPAVPAAPGGDPVGAGDAFLAALLVGRLRGVPLAALARGGDPVRRLRGLAPRRDAAAAGGAGRRALPLSERRSDPPDSQRRPPQLVWRPSSASSIRCPVSLGCDWRAVVWRLHTAWVPCGDASLCPG